MDNVIQQQNKIFLYRVPKKELVLVFRQMSVMLRSGLSLVHCLQIMQMQSSKKGLRCLLGNLLCDVEEGFDFSDAMRRTKKFTLYDVSMVKAAEESGELDIILEAVAEQMEKNMEFRSQLITSMIYPVMVSIMALATIIILSVYVVPKFASILGSKGRGLPLPTQLMLNISDWMQEWWITIVFALIFISLLIPLLRKTAGGGYFLDWMLLKLPVIGLVLQCGFIVGFARNMAILIRSGMTLSDAVLIVRDTLKNAVARELLNQTYTSILEGAGMAETLRNARKVFPPMVAEMVATGEETGEMVQVLHLTAGIYQRMMETYVKRLNAMIEPLIIVVLGGIVGFVVMALMMGVMSMYSSV